MGVARADMLLDMPRMGPSRDDIHRHHADMRADVCQVPHRREYPCHRRVHDAAACRHGIAETIYRPRAGTLFQADGMVFRPVDGGVPPRHHRARNLRLGHHRQRPPD